MSLFAAALVRTGLGSLTERFPSLGESGFAEAGGWVFEVAEAAAADVDGGLLTRFEASFSARLTKSVTVVNLAGD